MCFGLLAVLTVILCIPATLYPVVRIFGWVAYFYLALGYVFAVLHCLKRSLRLRISSMLFLVLSLVFIIATLQVVFCDKTTTGSLSRYIVGSYTNPTVGGVVFSIITSPIVVYCTPVWAIVIFLVFAACFTFLFFRPLIFNVGKNIVQPVEPRTEDDRKVISKDAPVTRHLRAQQEPQAQHFNVAAPESSKDRAMRILLGGDYDVKSLAGDPDETDTYLSRSYKFAPRTEASEESKKRATRVLLGEDGSESSDDFDRMEKEMGLSEKPQSRLFEGSEADLKLFSGGAHFADPTFGAAVRQTETAPDAPAPLNIYGNMPPISATMPEPTPYASPATPYVAPQPSYAPPQPQPYIPPQPVYSAPAQPAETYQQIPQQPYYAAPTRSQPAPQPFVAPVQPEVPQPQPAPEEPGEFSLTRPYMPAPPTREYVFPPKSLLEPHSNPAFTPYVDNWDELQEVVEKKLQNFGITAHLVDAHKGPTVTQVIMELGESCTINKLTAVSKDLRRLLKSNNDITIVPQIPDTSYCGIEIPNKVRQTVSFQEVIASKEYNEAKGDIVLGLGKAVSGEPYLVEDLAAMPHALIAGQTGSGKSVCINVILASILLKYRPDEVKLILIDLKQVEMGIYSGLPHMLFKEPLFELHEIVNALKWIRQETDNRFNLFKSLHVRKLSEYNKLPDVQPLPRIVIVIDEASELMTKNEVRKTVEGTLSSLARVARAAGVHLLFATQNPVKEVITNEIQNNLNTKIAFAVGDFNHSMVIFKAKGAESLLGNGDMYIKRGQMMQRGQCAYISTEETEAIVNFIKENNETNFDDQMIGRILNGSFLSESESSDFLSDKEVKEADRGGKHVVEDKKKGSGSSGLSDAEVTNWQALKICYDKKNISCSYLQRRMNKGYNAMANILEYWEGEGFISPQGPDKRRTFLRSADEFYQLYYEKFGNDELDDIASSADDVSSDGEESYNGEEE